MNSKALMALMSRYRIEAVRVDGCDGIAVVDTAGDPLVVTAILFDADGLPLGGRAYFPATRLDESAESLLKGSTASLAEGTSLSAVLDFFGVRGRRSTFATGVATAFAVTPEGAGADRGKVEDAAISLLKAEGIDAIAARLDGGAIDALSCVTDFNRAAYAFYAKEGDVGLARRQAAASYPLLAGEISSKVLLKMAVDRRQPLVDILVKSFGSDEVGSPRMSKGILKKLTGRKLSDGGLPVQTIVNALSEIPVDWFPKDEEWDVFVDLADSFFRRLGPELGVKAGTLANGVGGKWREFAQRLARSYAMTQPPAELDEEAKKSWAPEIDVSREAMIAAAENVKDVIQAFRNYVILPVAANAGQGTAVFVGPEQLRHASDLAAQILFGGKSLTAVLELQRHWHTQEANVVNAAAGGVPALVKTVAEDGWPPLCDIVHAPNGVQIVPLTDERELQDEGRGWNEGGRPLPDRNGILGLAHCVATHAASAKNGSRHIVSFRVPTPDGLFVRLSTAEFYALKPESTKLEHTQHYGVGNSTPPILAQEAFNWFVAAVQERQIPINHDGIMTYLAGKRRVAEEIETYCEYDWKDEEAVSGAIEPWRPYLPKRLRDADLSAMQALPEMRELVQAIAPTYGYRASLGA